MPRRIPVVPHIPRDHGVDGVVASDPHVLAWMPFRAALAEDNVARHDVGGCGAFEAQTAAGGIGGAIGAALGCVRGVTALGKRKMMVRGGEVEGCEGCEDGGDGVGGWGGEGVGYSGLKHG